MRLGNLCFQVQGLFRENGIGAELYANHFERTASDVVRPVAVLEHEVRHADTILYFFSTMDPRLPSILQLSCKSKVACSTA